MKNLLYKASYLFVGLVLISCTRDEDDLNDATFPNTPEVFTDVPVNLTDQFFVSFDPNDGANTGGFSVDENEAFEGTASIRIDVPSATDPDGTFIGGIFEDRGDGRDLTDYNALTFYAKASTTATVGTLGFGNDFNTSTYTASLSDTELGTDWKKIVIPIPEPSRLVQERGMFLFSAGSASTDGAGYTFWVDEIKFENLASVAQPLKSGLDLTFTYNVDGTDVDVNAAAAYFEEEDFDFAPTPPERDADDVVSIFSDAYTDVPVDNYNGFFNFSTTQGGATTINDESFIRYTELNFVSINMFESTTDPDVDASEMTHIHVDVNVREPLDPGDFLRMSLNNDNDGSNGGETSDAVTLTNYQALVQGEWVSYDIPLTDFGGVGTPDDIDLIFFISDATISEVLIDNVYFYRN